MNLILVTVFTAISFIVYGYSSFISRRMKSEYARWGYNNQRKLVGSLQLLGGVGLLIGGLFPKKFFEELGDLITRFSGITICSIMTGVIWIGQPETFMDVILYDNLHVLLWVGGLFFALRGNRT